jgi:hypothetical protein
MLLRIRWFIVGALTSLGVISFLIKEVRRVRDRITPHNLARRGLRGVADLLDTAADAVATTGEKQ